MNSAELVNLILEKLRRVKFVAISQHENGFVGVCFTWGHNNYMAIPTKDRHVSVFHQFRGAVGDIYTERIEGMLNGLVRNDAGELVKP